MRDPVQLRRLFSLRYLEGVRDRDDLAHFLGVSKECLSVYFNRLRHRLNVKGALTISSEDMIEKSKAFICPECLRMSVLLVDGGVNRVCGECGLELGRWEMDDSLPFDTTFAPTSSIALGRSLGDTLPSDRTYRVLLKSQIGEVRPEDDFGLRARFINIVHKANETPTVKRLVEYGSGLLKKLGLEDDHILANIFGNALRELGDYLQAKRVNRTHRHVHALLGFLLERFMPEKAGELRPSLRYGEEERDFIDLWMMLDDHPAIQGG